MGQVSAHGFEQSGGEAVRFEEIHGREHRRPLETSNRGGSEEGTDTNTDDSHHPYEMGKLNFFLFFHNDNPFPSHQMTTKVQNKKYTNYL